MNSMFGGFSQLKPVVKNLIIINAIMLVLYYLVNIITGTDLNAILGLYYPKSESFMPVQVVTHMFMHGNFWHLFFNMWALFMFGSVLETVWGPKRFLLYYFVTGLGAAFTHELVQGIQYSNLLAQIGPQNMQLILDSGREAILNHQNFVDPLMAKMNVILNVPTVGASGAIFGLLLAYGMLFPNTILMFIFPPIPVKAKYVVIGYGAIELYLAVTQPGSNIAHVAHLGGMIFGYIMIRYWA